MEQRKTAGPAAGAALRGLCNEEVEKVSQMDSQISFLCDAVSFLEDQVSRLETRLSCVSISDNPTPDCAKAEAIQLVPMAEALYHHRGVVNRVNDRIGSLLERLEV